MWFSSVESKHLRMGLEWSRGSNTDHGAQMHITLTIVSALCQSTRLLWTMWPSFYGAGYWILNLLYTLHWSLLLAPSMYTANTPTYGIIWLSAIKPSTPVPNLQSLSRCKKIMLAVTIVFSASEIQKLKCFYSVSLTSSFICWYSKS